MTSQSIRTELADGIATLTIDRPAQLNAVDEPTRLALAAALRTAGADPAVRAVILTGAGRAFCVGQDLAAAHELDDCEDCVRRTYNPVVEQLATLFKPVIAAVNGPAVGAGLGFALACDIVLMAEGAFLSCAFGKVGLIPDSGATFHLVRALGHRRAFEIAASGRRIAADEAVSLGLANRVLTAEALLPEARALAADLAKEPPKALAITKRLIRDAQHGSLAQAISAEAMAQGVLGGTQDHIELREAFLARSRK